MFKITPKKNGLENVQGFSFNGTNVGFKDDEADVGFIRSETPCDISAVFTTNKFQAAPIVHFNSYDKDFKTNFLLVNSKNANAMTGAKGVEDIEAIFSTLSSKLELINPIMSSTGVIGYRLNQPKLISAFDKFDFKSRNSDMFSQSIMTTDSFKKELAYSVTLEDGSSFNIAAVCKGAGMINPSMATMLCFVITDADIPKSDMDEILLEATYESFNKISVDGDTSTNDTVMLLANQSSASYDKEAFSEAINMMMFELSQMILRDGEGSNKVVAFEVINAKNKEEARKVSMALSNSLLVKTALFGEDPNWGRIASTVGSCGVLCDEESLKIYYNDLLIYSCEYRELDKIREDKASIIMKKDSFRIICDLGVGKSSFTSYGCDLSYEYVKINAEYRT
ncbi:MAG TPA: bifunctional glutamate N-acetyltransferase/amino-acid acetyltransferase ArgJ [Campylobacterales bacterium]|nr:bifunctional glutamate N-acetyltransferase/amino-acid acetyltransferase ArgJ [Campylobacterales bacterium]